MNDKKNIIKRTEIVHINKEPNSLYDLKCVEKARKNKEILIDNNSERFVFSINGKGKLRETYSKMIEIAKDTILLVNWLFVDEDTNENQNNQVQLKKKLIEATKRLKGRVFIITASQRPRYKSEIKDYFDSHLQILKELHKAGAFIKGYENAHGKVLIVDDKKALITSANYTYNSFTKNVEIGLVIDDQTQLSILKQWFNYVWKYVANNILTTNGEFRGYKTHEPMNHIVKPISTSNIYWTYRKNKAFSEQFLLKNKIKEMIKKAKRSIIILTYSFDDLNEIEKEGKELRDILKKAINNNIKVELITTVEAKQWQSQQIKSKYAIINTFHEDLHKLTIKACSNMHAKLLLIDNNELVIFTGNLDRFLFNSSSLDIGVVSREREIIQEAIKFLNLLREKTNSYKVVQLNQKIEKRSDKKYFFFAKSEEDISFSKTYWSSKMDLEEFCELLKNNPVIFGQDKSNNVEVYCNGHTIKLEKLPKGDNVYKIDQVISSQTMRATKYIPINSTIEILVPQKKKL